MYINLLIRIKNAQSAGKKSLKVPFSRMDENVLKVLKEYKFIRDAEVKGKSYKRVIDIKCDVENPIHGVNFLSKPSLRKYGKYDSFKKVKNNYGILIVSTSKGIMSGSKARRQKIGGQLLFEIW